MNAPFTRVLLLAAGALLTAAVGVDAAQDLSPDEAAYRQVVRGRAEKIVTQLQLSDPAQAERVTTLIADYYRGLRDLHDARDAQLEELAGGDEQPRTLAKHESQLALQKQRRTFLAGLSADLSAEQVDRVKDGLTYGVVGVTMGAYRELLPGLTDEEQRYIYANLVEARDYAMEGGSSHEKHGWFGKYKGRINNYLSARGYDLKQAERELAEHEQQAANQSKPQE
ncbi:hypothetical protein Pla123a_13870 [Posidoniimonas polymericola]|uniref:DUF3826 domain-containing protein n=1 Tax=Posidoniimonas polymericola TaxID=2528002 RepID=A0A5C5YRL8_9BACT|nr:DUF3826 domain-containing protein [Posidoniimonas polymericola]TWT77591.1 hypothetical protein Pla123a_13870 [Posidoniimonas polymericola]